MSVYVSKIWVCEICTSLYSVIFTFSTVSLPFALFLFVSSPHKSDCSTLSSTTQSRIKSVQLTYVEAPAFVLQRLQLCRQPGRWSQNLLFHSDIIMGNCIQIWKPTESWFQTSKHSCGSAQEKQRKLVTKLTFAILNKPLLIYKKTLNHYSKCFFRFFLTI